mmetsp:Transcript_44598/g.108106  ORF Transcript_44598/g.108106 Transcript_44598/m.108106 type:complete len:90 (-) Transcript_44598:934-1203(-)
MKGEGRLSHADFSVVSSFASPPYLDTTMFLAYLHSHSKHASLNLSSRSTISLKRSSHGPVTLDMPSSHASRTALRLSKLSVFWMGRKKD